ncbi:MAG: RES domain-containing protein [Candidatus Korobacteraceae bacterium]
MRCCEACFTDDYLKNYIGEHGERGSCEYCGSRNNYVIDAGELERLFTRFTELYAPVEIGINIPSDAEALDYGQPLADLIQEQWEIFDERLVEHDRHHDLLDDIFTANRGNDELVLAPAVRDLWTDHNWLHRSLLDHWHELVDELKNPEEHHAIAPDLQPSEEDVATAVDTLQWFEEDIERTIITLPAGSRIFRARLGYRERDYRIVPFPPEEMSSPPSQLVDKPGRANPVGVSFFYAAKDERTAVAEKRPHTGALVSVAECVTLRDLRLLDLPKGMRMSTPFECSPEYLPSILESCELFNHLDTEFSKPLRHTDDVRDYLPTQFFVEWTKNHRYDGLLYTSAMSKDGINIVIFDPTVARVDSVRLVRVDAVEVAYRDYTGDGD